MTTTKRTTRRSGSSSQTKGKTGGASTSTPVDEKPKPLTALYPTVTDDDHVKVGHFAQVTAGEHAGRYGHVVTVAQAKADGSPKTVVFHTRDDRDEDLVVDYDQLVPDVAGGRR